MDQELPKWVRGTIAEQTGQVLYPVKTDDKVWRTHLEQLRADCSIASPHSELSDDAGQAITVADDHVPATTQDLPGDQESFPAETSEITAAVQIPPLPHQAAVVTRSGRVTRTPARFSDYVMK